MCRPAGSSRVETAVYAILGLASLLTIVIALLSGSLPQGPQGDPTSILARYVRSGQVLADCRTATAMLHYLLEPESLFATNPLAAVPVKRNSTAPTNAATCAPKV
jgi:hypothetical protein